MTVNQVVSPRLVRVQGASPPWLARLSIDTPVTSPARILVDLHRDTRKFNQHRLLASFAGIQTNRAKTLKFADRTERCEIRRDSCAMGGNVCSELVVVLAEFEIGNAVYLRGVTAGVWCPLQSQYGRKRKDIRSGSLCTSDKQHNSPCSCD